MQREIPKDRNMILEILISQRASGEWYSLFGESWQIKRGVGWNGDCN